MTSPFLGHTNRVSFILELKKKDENICTKHVGDVRFSNHLNLRQLLSTVVPAARVLQHLHRFNVGGEPGNNIRSRHSLENAYDHKYD